VAVYKLAGGGLILLGNELYLLSQSVAERTTPRPGTRAAAAAAAACSGAGAEE
jgi:hypothetical protein